MKKQIIFILIIILGIGLQAQDYHPLIRPNTYWDVAYPGYFSFCYSEINRYEFTENDTLINGNHYRIHNIYPFSGSPGPGGNICAPFVVDTIPFQSFIMREDTIEKKVYIYDGPSEYLLYDFSLEVGDTLKSEYTGNWVLEAIEDELLLNGEIRKKFIFDDEFNGMIYYIESIGNPYGLFEAFIPPYGPASELFCVKESGEDIWGGYCNNYFVGVDTFSPSSLRLFPNPAQDVIHFGIGSPLFTGMMHVFSSDGSLESKTPLNGESTVTVNISSLPVGMHFYHFINSKGEITATGKFVKRK